LFCRHWPGVGVIWLFFILGFTVMGLVLVSKYKAWIYFPLSHVLGFSLPTALLGVGGQMM
jgi:hypothetical protein